MAILVILTAIIGILEAALLVATAAIQLPEAPTGIDSSGATVNVVTWFFDLIFDGIAFLHALLPADFWQFCGNCLTLLITAHLGFIAYSVATSLIRDVT